MDQYIGKLLDNRYEIMERVGIGGMAVVYKGRDHRLNRLVAIKILKEELAQDADIRRRFHDESQAVAMLSHPNIVAVYDVSRSDEMDYIVMELIEGITLKQYMQRKGGKLSWKESLHFITQIMKALSHAHSRGIIHRDIKPHNVMVLQDGTLKVADFGIARVTSANQSTMTQEALGSVHYISPEQARGSHIDARSDIYSAGVVLYEMLTGRLPYEGDSPVAVAIQHINSVPLSPRELEPDIPEALEAITMKAMASDVNRRYISADAMLEDLEAFRRNPDVDLDFKMANLHDTVDEPTQIIGANSPSSITRSQQRRTAPNHYASTEGGTTRIDRSAVRARTEQSAEAEELPEEEPRSRGPIIAAVAAVLIFLFGIGIFVYSTVFGSAGKPAQLNIPDLTGKTLEEAMQLEEVISQNLQIVEGDPIPSSEYPEKEIAAQDPVSGTRLSDTEENRIVTVNLSSGPEEKLRMPDLSEDTWAQAKARLENLNIEYEKKEEASEDVPKDSVIRQDPAADTELKEGETVTVWVSTGPEENPVTVPSFLTQTLETAQNMAKQAGLKLQVKEVYDDTWPEKYVIDQDPAANTELAEGGTVVITVSKGSEPVESTAPSTEPTPPPEGSGEGEGGGEEVPPATSTKRISVDLPQDGREKVHVRVTVGDQTVYDQEVETSFQSIPLDITGSGTQQVTIYIDGLEDSSYPLDF